MITNKIFAGLFLIVFSAVIFQAAVFAQQGEGFCTEEGSRFRTYPQCGGTLGLEDKPIDQTFWVTACTSPSGIRTYQNRSLGNLGQCPTEQCPSVVEEYGQCGGTTGTEKYPRNHTIKVWRVTDCNGNITYQGQDLGDKGECSSNTPTSVGSTSTTTLLVPKDTAEVNAESLPITQSQIPTNISPNQNRCGNKYPYFKTALGNFGDPRCDYSKDGLYSLLKQNDGANADFWFYTVVRCESSYDPNNYNPGAVDSAGAWGLFQMGRGLNGVYDHGDVVWQLQTTNAVNYNNNLRKNGRAWQYWACAQGRW